MKMARGNDATPMTARDTAVRRVMRSVSRRVMVTPLPVQAPDGSYPVIVALPDDTMGSIELRRDRIGRDVNIVVAYPERMAVIAMRDGQSDDPAEVSPSSTIGMLVAWLRATPDERPAIRVAPMTSPVLEEMEYVF